MKTNQEIAKEVIQGMWGNGEERKQKLWEAGYNYGAVQSIVNAIMAGQVIETQEEEQAERIEITGTETLKVEIDLSKYNSIEVTFTNGGEK